MTAVTKTDFTAETSQSWSNTLKDLDPKVCNETTTTTTTTPFLLFSGGYFLTQHPLTTSLYHISKNPGFSREILVEIDTIGWPIV